MKTKIIHSAILVAILFSTSSAIQAQPGFRTDVDANGTVNVSDVSSLISFILGRVSDDAVTEGLCPNALHPHVIDLGLPSGTKWTCCNIGAENPIEYGDYYSWGENITKNRYGIDDYFYYNSDEGTYDELGNIAGTTCDVATIKWGSEYTMPSYEQFYELLNNCTKTWTTVNGVYGRLLTASNGQKIFFPANGIYDGTNYVQNAGYAGNYWSSEQVSDKSHAFALYLHSDRIYITQNWDRYAGCSIRPVSK